MEILDLSSKSEYVKIVSKNTYSQIITTGIVVSIILGIVSIVFISVLFNIWKIKNMFHYIIVFTTIVVITNTISYIVAKRSIGKTMNLANKFIDFIEKLSIALNCDRVELLENTPLPYIAVFKQSKYYIVIKYYDYYTEVNILDPFKISRSEGYIPIYIRKHSEIMSCRDVGIVKTCIYRVNAVLPEPGEDAIIEGLFYSREFRIVKRDVDYLIKAILSVLREILETSTSITSTQIN